MAVACVSLFSAGHAAAETRTLKIYHVHLNERSEITFKRNGRFLPDGLNKLNRALRDWRRNEPTKMDPRLFDLIWEVQRKAGSNGYINVIGGYRSSATNSMLRKRSNGVAEKSQHIRGKAMDFYIPGVSLKNLRNAGLRAQVGGVGYYPSSGSPFVHMDVGNVRHWPRLSRRELMAVFPDGKTVHVPSDGKPLAGYQVALAANASRKARGSSAVSFDNAPETGKRRTLLAVLFGGGADEEEDTEAVAVAAAAPKPAKKQAAPVEPLPLPDAPAQPVIVATLPRRQAAEANEPLRPSTDVGNEAAPETLAFAIPVPNKKPRFAAVQAAVVKPDQDAIAAAIATGNGEQVAADPEADAAAIRSALGQDLPVTEEPFFAGSVPVPGRKPKAPEILLASVAVPVPRPEAGQAQPVDAAAELVALAAATPADLDPVTDTSAGETVASVPSPSAKPVAEAQTMRTAMLENGAAEIDSGVKTTTKSAKPKQVDAKPGRKSIAAAPTPKVGRFALNSAPVAIENQPIAPEYAQALVRAAPTEVYVAGFSQVGPLEASKFSGKAVNFLRIAKFSNK
ncbi:MAG: DUF882 domain-containing protein [Rhizobiaceae bacterium]